MAKKMIAVEKWDFQPLTTERWTDFETLFGPNGACAGCWCAWFLMTNREFTEAKKDGHKQLMRDLVEEGIEPGIIAYADGVPAGWVALAPRERYKRLATSKQLGAVDDEPVWLIPCFFIQRDYRRQGMMTRLLTAAIDYARGKGVKTLEAFPLDVDEKINSMSLFSGKSAVFYELGFKEVARRDSRPIVRLKL